MRYFANEGDCISYWDTLSEAEMAAQRAIDEYRDACDPEWPDEVESVCFGVVVGMSESVPCGDNMEFVDYRLRITHEELKNNEAGGNSDG